MSKEIHSYSDVESKILSAVDIITEPIKQTLGPKGGNVLCEDDEGTKFITNDGVTIAKNISVSDGVQNAIIETIKHASLKTNTEVGDGTSTTVLLSSILIKGGIKLINDGHNQMDIKAVFENFGEELKDELQKQKLIIKSDKDLKYIANISSNNDDKIAEDVVDIVNFAGEYGHVMLEPGFSGETKIEKSAGFITNGMLSPDLRVDGANSVNYEDVPVLVTDKKLYYKEEAQTILKTCLDNKYKNVVIIASDFIGKALPTFIANHEKGIINILLVKSTAKDTVELDDMSVFLGGKLITDKRGSIVDKLKIEDFMIAKKVFSNQFRTVLSSNHSDSKELTALVSALREELEENGNKESVEYKRIEKRLASLTTGMVTVKVGGDTAVEVKEKMYRYEDAVNAARTANKHGYLIGGGIAILNAYNNIKKQPTEYSKLFKEYAEANIRQLAENAGEYGDNIIEAIQTATDNNIGYNALTGQYEDLLEAGVIDPYKVTELAIDNSISIAGAIISSRYIITNQVEKND